MASEAPYGDICKDLKAAGLNYFSFPFCVNWELLRCSKRFLPVVTSWLMVESALFFASCIITCSCLHQRWRSHWIGKCFALSCQTEVKYEHGGEERAIHGLCRLLIKKILTFFRGTSSTAWYTPDGKERSLASPFTMLFCALIASSLLFETRHFLFVGRKSITVSLCH